MKQLESGLREAFARRDPPPDFTDRVMARLAPARPSRQWSPGLAAIAAALVLLLTGGAYKYEQEQRLRQEGERAKAELVFALEAASKTLHYARAKILKTEDKRL